MEMFSINTSDGARLTYGLTGPEQGVPVMLCHGLGAGGAQFAEDAEFFASHGYRVITPDLRGHATSGMPAHIGPEAFSTERLRADLYAMLEHAGMSKVHWVGNSLGGILGLGVAAEQPKRLQSLSLFGTALALDIPAAGWMFPVFDRVPGRRAMAWLTAQATTKNKAARPLIADLLRHYDARAAGFIVDHIRHYDLRDAASTWSGPALILVGGRDRAVNKALLGQLDVLRQRPNWQIVDLPEGGHCANLDATQDWRSALLNFWSVPSFGKTDRDIKKSLYLD